MARGRRARREDFLAESLRFKIIPRPSLRNLKITAVHDVLTVVNLKAGRMTMQSDRSKFVLSPWFPLSSPGASSKMLYSSLVTSEFVARHSRVEALHG